MHAAFSTNGSITITSPDYTDLVIHIKQGTDTYMKISRLLYDNGDIIPEPALPKNIRRKSPKDFAVDDDSRTHVNIGTGEDSDIILDLTKHPNTLISGGAGSGKTILLSNVIGHGLHYSNINLHIMCLKPEEYRNLKLRDQDERQQSWSSVLSSLIVIKNTIKSRYTLMENNGWMSILDNDHRQSADYLIIDDNDVMFDKNHTRMSNVSYENYSDHGIDSIRTLISETLEYIMKFGKQAGVFTFIATQHPDYYHNMFDAKSSRIQCGCVPKITANIGLGDYPEYSISPHLRGRAIINQYHVQRPFQIPFVEHEVIYKP